MPLSEDEKVMIAEEERTLETVYASLHQQNSYLSTRIREEAVRAQFLTQSLVTAQRDEDKQLLANDESVSHSLLATRKDESVAINKLLDKPYFARVVLEEDLNGRLQQIEYKIGAVSNTECRIIDWRRAPIARLFYEYKEGDEYFEVIQGRERSGVVKLRNKIDIADRRLARLSCRYGNFSFDNGEWRKASGAGVRTGGAAAYGALPDVLSLITAEQFRAITEEADTAVLIQGIAGSGKTTVALYRLAWLLHEDNSDLKPADCLVLALNRSLKNYISHTLPLLSVHGVRVLTYQAWAEEILCRFLGRGESQAEVVKRPAKPSPMAVRRLKNSVAMLRRIEEYAVEQTGRLKEYLAAELSWDRLPEKFGKRHAELNATGAAPLALLDELLAQVNALRKEPEHQQGPAAEALASAELKISSAFRRMQLFYKDLVAVLSEPSSLLRFDETRLLDADIVRQALQHSRSLESMGLVEPEDDALLLRLIQLKWGSFAARSSRHSYRHIVVDEVQEFSPPELAVLIDAVDKTKNLTLVGDVGQHTSAESSFPGWEKLQQYWELGGSLASFVKLTISHRSTLPIMRLADFVSGQKRTTGGRPGKRPLWFKCLDENDGVKHCLRWLNRTLERHPGALVIVVCRDTSEARHVVTLLEPSFFAAVRLGDQENFSFEEGIVVTDAQSIKGLEFPHVLIWNPSTQAYGQDPLSRNKLYVAVTRAEENLCLVSWGRPSKLLPDIHSRLVRGFDRTEDLDD